MRNDTLRKAGLLAVILLAPGGFVLGASLLVRRHRARARERDAGGLTDPEQDEALH